MTAELIELRGVATEGAVLNLTIEVEDQLVKMHNEGLIKQIMEPDKKKFFIEAKHIVKLNTDHHQKLVRNNHL